MQVVWKKIFVGTLMCVVTENNNKCKYTGTQKYGIFDISKIKMQNVPNTETALKSRKLKIIHTCIRLIVIYMKILKL